MENISFTTSLYKTPKPMRVKTKIINPEIPTPPLAYAKAGDAGIDLTATSVEKDGDGNVVYGTNRAFEIPEGYVGLLFPRSSNAKKDLILSNSVGIIDCGFRGEVFLKFKTSIEYDSSEQHHDKSALKLNCFGHKLKLYEVGDRIGQLLIIPYPQIEFEEVQQLSETERGTGAYGSTGK